jgi:hypothetical protein
MSLPGKLLYRLWYQPFGKISDTLAAGGPFEMRRTEHGRAEMEKAAKTLPQLPAYLGQPLELHLLTGRRFWYQTVFCLWTLGCHTKRPLAPVIYDDGTLASEQQAVLARLFPNSRFCSQNETIARLDALLPRERFPVLRERWLNYPNLRKLTDPHLGSTGWKLVLDSDLLFFHPPTLLVGWLDAPSKPLHAVDVQRSYGYSDALLASLVSAPLADKLNVGLCGLRSEEIDWEKMEWFCRTLIAAERTNYYLEQALVALLLAGRECTITPAHDYVTLPRPPEAQACQAVMHHYVANSKRSYFQHCWRHAAGAVS